MWTQLSAEAEPLEHRQKARWWSGWWGLWIRWTKARFQLFRPVNQRLGCMTANLSWMLHYDPLLPHFSDFRGPAIVEKCRTNRLPRLTVMHFSMEIANPDSYVRATTWLIKDIPIQEWCKVRWYLTSTNIHIGTDSWACHDTDGARTLKKISIQLSSNGITQLALQCLFQTFSDLKIQELKKLLVFCTVFVYFSSKCFLLTFKDYKYILKIHKTKF
jgi:hypothetical protein